MTHHSTHPLYADIGDGVGRTRRGGRRRLQAIGDGAVDQAAGRVQRGNRGWVKRKVVWAEDSGGGGGCALTLMPPQRASAPTEAALCCVGGSDTGREGDGRHCGKV